MNLSGAIQRRDFFVGSEIPSIIDGEASKICRQKYRRYLRTVKEVVDRDWNDRLEI